MGMQDDLIILKNYIIVNMGYKNEYKQPFKRSDGV